MLERDFPQLPIEVINVVEPKLFKASEITGCYELNLSQCYVQSHPLQKEGTPEKEKNPHPTALLSRMISDGWRLTSICWKRDDEAVSYGNDPAVRHVLVAILVKTEIQG